MANITAILFNGPPRCGKTYCRQQMIRLLPYTGNRVWAESFIQPMRSFVAAAFGTSFLSVPKDDPLPELGGDTVRRLLIDMSENYIKPNYGQGVWGQWLARRVMNVHLTYEPRLLDKPSYVVIDDLGFPAEAKALNEAGINTFIVHVERPGCDFVGDSRFWVEPRQHVVYNSGTLDDLNLELVSLAEKFK